MFKSIIGKDIAIKCNNSAEKREFLQWCKANDVKWIIGEININSEVCKGTNCYSIKDNNLFTNNFKYYIDNDYFVIDYKEFVKENSSKANTLLEKLRGNRIAVRCEGDCEKEEFLNYCSYNSIKGVNKCKELYNSCYAILENNELDCSHSEYFSKRNYKVVNCSDFFKSKKSHSNPVLEKLIKDNIVIECDTKEEELKFLQWCIDNNLPWFNGNSVTTEISRDSKGRYTIEPTNYSSVSEYGLLLALASYGEDRIKKYSELFPQVDGLTLVEVYSKIKDGEVYEDVEEGLVSISKIKDDIRLFWYRDITGLTLNTIKFKLKSKPLTFNEVVELNKKNPVYCTVEHWLIKKDYHKLSGDVWKEYASGEYVLFSELLCELSHVCGEFISEIILNGEWYVKEGN